MFNRKSMLMAILAVALLVSLLVGESGGDKRRRPRHRAMVESSIAIVDQTLQQAGIKNLMDQIAGTAKMLDPSHLWTNRLDRKPRRPRHIQAAVDPAIFNLVAGTAKTLDPSGSVREARVDLKPRRPRHGRTAVDPAGFNLIAGTAKALDPGGRIPG